METVINIKCADSEATAHENKKMYLHYLQHQIQN